MRERASRALRVTFSPGEWFVAASCFAASLTPSLYPRPRISQGLLSGLAVVAGLALGRAVAAGLRRLPGPKLSAVGRRALRGAVLGGAAVVAIWALWLNHRWQLDVRETMAIEGSAVAYLSIVVGVAVPAAYTLLLLARLVRAALRAYRRSVANVVPRRWRGIVHAVVFAVAVVVVVDVVIAGGMVSAVNDRLIAANARSDADVVRPTSRFLSGGPGSHVTWGSLGRMGRRFVGTAPDVEDLTDFNGAPATPPVRVYAGLGSAPTARDRADVAVAELERTGGFHRRVLTIITTTGTGSVNRDAIAPLEYMYNGNTAAVAIQYSYLPSWIVMGGDQDRAATSAKRLFAAVMERVAQQPPGRRPQIVLYGESLGAFGSEQVFEDVADVRAQVDGVLWVGPPRASRLWRSLTENRDARSPVWQPVYEEGAAVRFGADGADLQEPSGTWTKPRVVYLQHPTDPVTFWSPDLAFQRPEWLRETRPSGVSEHVPYVPVVTLVQTAIDMVLGGGAPMHFGHMYGTEQAEAWALVAPPGDWTAADTQRLVTHLEE